MKTSGKRKRFHRFITTLYMVFMMNIEQMRAVLDALPDPAFILSRSGGYIAVFGGRDSRYYHEGSSLIGKRIGDVLKAEKAAWFLKQIDVALRSGDMMIVEYELSNKDVQGLPEVGPEQPIWFEGRIQALDFTVDDEPVVLWVASNISARHQLEMTLRHLSDTDQLTGLFNRRKLERELAQQFSTFKRYHTPTSILMLDLDNLKQLNDAKGHQTGDRVILEMANICREELRESDIACRFGGDEFAIILPSTDFQQAKAFAERLNETFNAHTANFVGPDCPVTVSIGVTEFIDSDESHEDALRRVDTLLYDAKHQGKNRIVVTH
ncbi:sensor domain-containing diguanylate cyclase [Alteromonas sp. CYL-A6]|uniref:sensor domain-containing diguanylate cyclase n=1 Tax=Alteromonas nitratireducens TaxID=3390813 RepID=UPI0034A7AAE0